MKTYIVTPHLNIFHRQIRKIIPKLSLQSLLIWALINYTVSPVTGLHTWARLFKTNNVIINVSLKF